jgi:hypothetical protein
MGDFRSTVDGPPTLILGYSQMSESRIAGGVTELATAVHEVTTSRPARRAVPLPFVFLAASALLGQAG